MKLKPSPSPEGKQKIMEKYTKLVMKRLYGEDVYVFFTDDFYWSEGGVQLSGMFRDKDMGPPKKCDEMIWVKDPKCSITFKGAVYSKDSLSPSAWSNIVHEVSHFEVGVKSTLDRKVYHTAKFNEIFKSNLKKVDDLRKRFNKEVGWDEDFVYGGTNMGHYYVELIAEINTEDTPGEGGCDQAMERLQDILGDIVEDSNILLVRAATKEEIKKLD